MKKRKINFFELSCRYRGNHYLQRFEKMGELLDFASGLGIRKRKYKVSTSCFMFMEKVSKVDQGYFVIFRYVKTAYRPDLYDAEDMSTRENPKKISEGEGEKTHCFFQMNSNGFWTILLEVNGFGAGHESILKCLKYYFNMWWKDSGGKTHKPILCLNPMAQGDIKKEFERFKRVRLGTIYTSKKILGSDVLNYSDRTQEIREDIEITVKSKRQRSVKTFFEDVFNSFISNKSEIDRLRIEGLDQNNDVVILNSDLLFKSKFIDVEINASKGDVKSHDVKSKFLEIAKTLKDEV